MIYSRVVGSGSYLPPRVMDNEEFARPVSRDLEALAAFPGFRQLDRPDLAAERPRAERRAHVHRAELVELRFIVGERARPDDGRRLKTWMTGRFGAGAGGAILAWSAATNIYAAHVSSAGVLPVRVSLLSFD